MDFPAIRHFRHKHGWFSLTAGRPVSKCLSPPGLLDCFFIGFRVIADVPSVSRPAISAEIQQCQGTLLWVGAAGLEPAVEVLMAFAEHAVRYSYRPIRYRYVSPEVEEPGCRPLRPSPVSGETIHFVLAVWFDFGGGHSTTVLISV